MCQILKISAACYDEVLFLTPHCSKVLQYFIISIFLFTLSRALRPSLFLVSLSLKRALHSSSKHATVVILQTHILSPHYHHRNYLHPHCLIRIQFLHHPITLRSLRYLHTHMPPSIACSLSTPSFLFTVYLVLSVHSFLLFLSFSLRLYVSLSLYISSLWVLGVAGMQCLVWLGCGAFSWIVVGLYGGLVSGFCVLILVSFNFSGFDWFWWVFDFGGWVRGLIGGGFGCWVWVDHGGWEMGWLWVWVDFGGWDLIFDFVILGLCCDFVI